MWDEPESYSPPLPALPAPAKRAVMSSDFFLLPAKARLSLPLVLGEELGAGDRPRGGTGGCAGRDWG